MFRAQYKKWRAIEAAGLATDILFVHAPYDTPTHLMGDSHRAWRSTLALQPTTCDVVWKALYQPEQTEVYNANRGVAY